MSELFIGGVQCGKCGGPVYMERCCDDHPTDHEWAVASECKRCGERNEMSCPECRDEAP